ncbi:MAG: ComF family protein [Deltaproteobacteria bacterium]|nr:ComF family protein [Deltaproteobacteria bacterium]MBW1922583.1 ComF family protein [Deltaproteobacteria bacterium]MBW2101572.1 ComF family protein [Deltaproteobacteria bacterium]MBW2347188.1 ComF family protein [Deltaproteobacteria bacterium]
MNLISSLLNLIYPPRCPVCLDFLAAAPDSEDPLSSFCAACLSGFHEISSPLCPCCGTPFPGEGPDHLCEPCLRKAPAFDALRAPYLYEGALMTAIHRLKYGGKSSLAHVLGPLLARFALGWLEARDPLVMPVPLHPRKLRERGFNQSLLLARHVARALDAKLDFTTLCRVRYTKPQTGLDREERRRNVVRAFEVRGKDSLKGLDILLVDDVATTGNTLGECAGVLKRRGAGRVFCLVLARAVRP